MKKLLKEWRRFLREEEPEETPEQAIDRKLAKILLRDQNQFIELLPASDKPLDQFLQPLGFEDILRLVANRQAANPEILLAVFEAAKEPEEAEDDKNEKKSWLRVTSWERRHLRNRIGQNPSTPPWVLWKILDDVDTRAGMTMNKAAPPEILDKLARQNGDYHFNIISNPNTSLETLEFISKKYEAYDDISYTQHHRKALADEEIERRKRRPAT